MTGIIMATPQFPTLDPQDFSATRDALHAYSGILGGWMSACRTPRKHWWHASLRPSLTGLSTGVIHADVDFEIELNFRESALLLRTAIGEQLREQLRGQSVSELGANVRTFLKSAGISAGLANAAGKNDSADNDRTFSDYLPEQANKVARSINAVSAALTSFRAGIREETSPIGLWPHHFDLAMLWLPGGKVSGQDPDNEEYSDKQMNFGFTFGDAGIPEPYFYVTAYPLPETFSEQRLPRGTRWHSEGFDGAVLRYSRLIQEPDPTAYLHKLWSYLLTAGRARLISDSD